MSNHKHTVELIMLSPIFFYLSAWNFLFLLHLCCLICLWEYWRKLLQKQVLICWAAAINNTSPVLNFHLPSYYKKDRLSQLKISQLLVSFFVLSFSGSEDQALLVEESIKHAKEAVMLDIKDGNSWCKCSCVVVRSFFP